MKPPQAKSTDCVVAVQLFSDQPVQPYAAAERAACRLDKQKAPGHDRELTMRVRPSELTLHLKGASCCSMELDFDGPLADRAYPILASLVVPRPIALVTTISPGGKVNAAPFSFFNVLGAEPPILAVANKPPPCPDGSTFVRGGAPAFKLLARFDRAAKRRSGGK